MSELVALAEWVVVPVPVPVVAWLGFVTVEVMKMTDGVSPATVADGVMMMVWTSVVVGAAVEAVMTRVVLGFAAGAVVAAGAVDDAAAVVEGAGAAEDTGGTACEETAGTLTGAALETAGAALEVAGTAGGALEVVGAAGDGASADERSDATAAEGVMDGKRDEAGAGGLAETEGTTERSNVLAVTLLDILTGGQERQRTRKKERNGDGDGDGEGGKVVPVRSRAGVRKLVSRNAEASNHGRARRREGGDRGPLLQ